MKKGGDAFIPLSVTTLWLPCFCHLPIKYFIGRKLNLLAWCGVLNVPLLLFCCCFLNIQRSVFGWQFHWRMESKYQNGNITVLIILMAHWVYYTLWQTWADIKKKIHCTFTPPGGAREWVKLPVEVLHQCCCYTTSHTVSHNKCISIQSLVTARSYALSTKPELYW